MHLSSTGLVEINATTLRVLRNGQLVDVLTLTASGSPDLPLGGLAIGHTAGLQALLNAKASTSALNATADSLGGEIDSVEAQVSALGDTLSAVGVAVAGKASQASLDATNATVSVAYANIDALGTSLNNGYGTLEASIATKASSFSWTRRWPPRPRKRLSTQRTHP